MFFKRKKSSQPLELQDSQSAFQVEQGLRAYDFELALKDMETSLAPFRETMLQRDKIKRPVWLTKSDGLFAIINEQWAIRRTGKIIYGALVQANNLLFEPGTQNSPGNMIYSHDPYYKAHPHELLRLASGLFSFKGDKGLSDETLQAIADILENEMDRNLYSELPLEYTNGRKVIMTGTMFERTHLPNGYIQSSIMPIIASIWAHETVMLPVHYWPASFLRAVNLSDFKRLLNPHLL